MKILVAVTSYQSYALVRGQLKYMTSAGHDVMFTSLPAPGLEEKINAEGATFFPIAMEREISVVKDIRAVIAAVKIINRFQPDVLNASTPKAGLIFMIASMFARKNVAIFTLRGLRSDTLSGPKRMVIRLTEKLTCAIASKVIVISPSLRDYAVREGIVRMSKSFVLGIGSSNGIDCARFQKAGLDDQANLLRKDLAIPEGAVVFGYLGRLVKDKGIVEIYTAFEKLSASFKNAYLIFTGDIEVGDPLNPDFLQRMKMNPNVRIVGHTEDVRVILSVYDVLILFSYREGFGNVVLEASCMEKPVLVADIPGARDTVEDGVTGLLVKARDAEDLFQKMAYYISDPERRFKHGIAGRIRCIENFSSELVWRKLLDFYTEAVQSNKG